MANDRQVIQYMSPVELVGLMNATGVVTVHDTIIADGKPVIHAALKVVNAETGEHLPGGLPFSVVMFKAPNEPGCSNIAIGTIVPASELKVALPRDYFNFCNQRFRFARVFPVDENSFVIQMDLVLRNATREYVKFSFGLWGALFSQMLFELIGRGRESLISAAEAYAQAHTDFAEQIATTPEVAVQSAPVEAPAAAPADAVTEDREPEAVLPLEAEAIVPAEDPLVELPEENMAPAGETSAVEAAEEAVVEAPSNEVVADETATDPVAPIEKAIETTEPVEELAEPELSIAAGPTTEPLPEENVPAAASLPAELADEPPSELAEEAPVAEPGEAEAKVVVPA